MIKATRTYLNVAQLYTTTIGTSAVHGSGVASAVLDRSIDDKCGPFVSCGIAYCANLLVGCEEQDRCLYDVLSARAEWEDVSWSRRVQEDVEPIREGVIWTCWFAVVPLVKFRGRSNESSETQLGPPLFKQTLTEGTIHFVQKAHASGAQRFDSSTHQLHRQRLPMKKGLDGSP